MSSATDDPLLSTVDVDNLLDEVNQLASARADADADRPMTGPRRPTFHAPTTFSTYNEVKPVDIHAQDDDDEEANMFRRRNVPLKGKLDPLGGGAVAAAAPLPHQPKRLEDVVGPSSKETDDQCDTSQLSVGGSSPSKTPNKKTSPEKPIIPLRQQIMVQKVVPQLSKAPKARWGHSGDLWQYGLYVFGGLADAGTTAVNDFMRFCLLSHVWEPVFTAKGSKPSERAQHASCITPNSGRLYIHGGVHEQTSLSDMHVFNLESQTWDQANVQTTSSCEPATHPRSGHTLVAVDFDDNNGVDGEKIFLFGGRSVKIDNETGKPRCTASHDFLVLDVRSSAWQKVEVAASSGPAPHKRFGHAACVSGGCMYIHGGEDRHGNKLNDLWEFNFDTASWQELIPNGTDGHAQRFRHRMFKPPGGSPGLLVIGGLAHTSAAVHTYIQAVDLTTLKVHNFTMWGAAAGRHHHGCAAAVSENGFLVEFGGVAQGINDNDVRMCLLTQEILDPATPLQRERTSVLWGHRCEDWGADTKIEIAGHTTFVHSAIIKSRAPHFFEKLLECEVTNTTTATTAATTTPDRQQRQLVHCLLDGNRRRAAFPIVKNYDVLLVVLRYLYTGDLPALPLDDELAALLVEVGVTFSMPGLLKILQTCCPRGVRGASPSASRVDKARATAQHQLREDVLGVLLQSGLTDGDVQLQVEDPFTHEIFSARVHGAFLIAASPEKFRCLITKSNNNNNNVLTIDGIKFPRAALEFVLPFLYLSSSMPATSIPPDLASSLLSATSALGLSELKRRCEVVLYKNGLTVENTCDVLSLADLHQARFLRAQCLELAGFVATNQPPPNNAVPNQHRLTRETKEELDRLIEGTSAGKKKVVSAGGVI
eukprot:PhM_4_TR11410/c0_g1_i1/m.19956